MVRNVVTHFPQLRHSSKASVARRQCKRLWSKLQKCWSTTMEIRIGSCRSLAESGPSAFDSIHGQRTSVQLIYYCPFSADGERPQRSLVVNVNRTDMGVPIASKFEPVDAM